MKALWTSISKGRENIRFRQSVYFCPYYEADMNEISETKEGIKEITINAFSGYGDIMQPLFDNEKMPEEEKVFLFDIYMHYLVELEYRTGMTQQEYDIQIIKNELRRGDFGVDIKERYEKLLPQQQYTIAHAIYMQYKSGASIMKFVDTLLSLLMTGVVYRDKIQEKTLYVYVGMKENDDSSNIIELVKKLFLPLEYSISVFWEKHFAVLGEQQTAILGKMELV